MARFPAKNGTVEASSKESSTEGGVCITSSKTWLTGTVYDTSQSSLNLTQPELHHPMFRSNKGNPNPLTQSINVLG